jgi:hypothetical protein
MIHSILTGLPNLTDYTKDHNADESRPGSDCAVPEWFDLIPLPKDAENPSLTDEVSKGACNTPEFHSYSGDSSSDPQCDEGVPNAIIVEDPSISSLSRPELSISSPSASVSFDPADIPLPPSAASTPPHSPTHTESYHLQTAHTLSDVLLLADELFSLFPPSTPQLRLTSTLGPASAMRTWAQEATLLPSDDKAEALVVSGENIVVRDALEPSSQRREPQRRPKKGSGRKVKRGETRLLVAGAVFVLGAAVVVGIQSRRGGAKDADWRRLFDTFGAFGERMLGMFDEVHLGL